jgi:hypothetical protein
MGLRRRLRQAEQITDGLFNSFELEDGSVYRYESKEVLDAFQNLFDRWGAEVEGRPDPGVHRFIENLRRARKGERERIVEEECSLVQLMLNEDQVFRGERERTGDHENATREKAAEHGVNQQA